MNVQLQDTHTPFAGLWPLASIIAGWQHQISPQFVFPKLQALASVTSLDLTSEFTWKRQRRAKLHKDICNVDERAQTSRFLMGLLAMRSQPGDNNSACPCFESISFHSVFLSNIFSTCLISDVAPGCQSDKKVWL